MDKKEDNQIFEKVEIFGKKEKKIYYFFNPFKRSFRRIRSDEEKKKKSIRFGLLAILFSCICVALCYPCIWLGIKCFIYGFTHYFGFFTVFFGLGHIFFAGLGAVAFVLPYYFWLQGISLVVMQLLLNRRIISWIALLFWLASVVLIFMLSMDSFAHIVGIGTAWFFK